MVGVLDDDFEQASTISAAQSRQHFGHHVLLVFLR